MRDYDIHQAQQTGELPGGGILAQFWRNLTRSASFGLSSFRPARAKRPASAR